MLAICIAVALQTQSNWNELRQTLTGKVGKHSYHIEIECANFQPRGRKLGWMRVGYAYYPAIGKRRLYESDGWSLEETRKASVTNYLKKHTIEVKRFEVTVDGKRWRVPSDLTFDLLNLNLNGPSPRYNYGQAWLTADGKRLVLKQSASDGAGSYVVQFTFRKTGLVERNIYSEDYIVDRRRGHLQTHNAR